MRVLFVHAHPDDESITTGASIAEFAARGAQVDVVTCTLGEEGEVLGSRWAGLVTAEADQLGGYRIGELASALQALGVQSPRFLGGAGRWRDSGMAGTPSADHPRAFVGSGERAVAQLVAVLDELAPDLVVTYDPAGGYGHPDHIRTHEVVHAAAARAARPPSRIAWTVTSATTLDGAFAGDPAPRRSARAGELPSWPEGEVTHVVRPGARADEARRAALRAHATQLELLTDDDGRWWFALTNGLLQPVPQAENYICMDARPGGGYERCAPAGGDAPDLLDGLPGAPA